MNLRYVLTLILFIWTCANGIALAQEPDHGKSTIALGQLGTDSKKESRTPMAQGKALLAAGTDDPHTTTDFQRADLEAAVETVLRNHPELILEVLEKKQIELAALVERGTIAKQLKAERDRRLAELQNPKTPDIDESRPIRGNLRAPVTIVEYSDFECPYCSAASSTVREVLTTHKGTVRFIYKHNPLSFHPMAEPAARYFEAIALQDHEQAWLFHDRVFAQQDLLAGGEEALKAVVASLEIDRERFKNDLSSETVKQRIAKDREEAERFGFDGTPAFLVNGVSLMGNRPLEDFEDLIQLSISQ